MLSLENVCGVVYNFSLLDLMPKNGSVFIQQQLREKQSIHSSSRKSEKQVWGVENMKRNIAVFENSLKVSHFTTFYLLEFHSLQQKSLVAILV
mgnify:FL=1